MQVEAIHENVSAQVNKGIGKVKSSGNASADKAQGTVPSKASDSVHTSPVARMMSREFRRMQDRAPVAQERLQALVSRFGGDAPANLADAEIDSVLHGILRRA